MRWIISGLLCNSLVWTPEKSCWGSLLQNFRRFLELKSALSLNGFTNFQIFWFHVEILKVWHPVILKNQNSTRWISSKGCFNLEMSAEVGAPQSARRSVGLGRRFERRCRRPVTKNAKIVCFRKLFLCSTRWYYSFLVWQTGMITPACQRW